MITTDQPTYNRLKPRQRLFVDEYTRCFSATKAARAAGYAPNSCSDIGAQNLGKPHIRSAINERLRELREEDAITPTWVRKTIKETIALCIAPKDRIACLDLLAHATPGTLEPLPTGTVNLFSLVGQLPAGPHGSSPHIKTDVLEGHSAVDRVTVGQPKPVNLGDVVGKAPTHIPVVLNTPDSAYNKVETPPSGAVGTPPSSDDDGWVITAVVSDDANTKLPPPPDHAGPVAPTDAPFNAIIPSDNVTVVGVAGLKALTPSDDDHVTQGSPPPGGGSDIVKPPHQIA